MTVMERTELFIEWTDIGTYHMENKKENEDAVAAVTDGRNAAVALCDGVSVCEHAKEGARAACDSLCSFFVRKSNKLAYYDRRTIARKAVSHILYDLKKQAELSGSTVESLSSTASCVSYDDGLKKLLCLNIGDALVGGIGKNGFEVIIEPQKGDHGCYTVTTKRVELAAEIAIVDADKYSSVFICSDGLWKQFFKNGQLSDEARECFDRGDYKMLICRLQGNRSFDDRSIVVMDIDSLIQGKETS